MLNWIDDYLLDIEDIDLQHRYFLALINRLETRLSDGDNLRRRERLLHELASYARFHFVSEENLMLDHGFPGYEAHRQQHTRLLQVLGEEMQAQKLEISTPQVLIMMLETWFIEHTQVEDRRYADFLHAAG